MPGDMEVEDLRVQNAKGGAPSRGGRYEFGKRDKGQVQHEQLHDKPWGDCQEMQKLRT